VIRRSCVLSAVDLGADTERVLSYAAYVGARTKSTVRLLYVIDYLLTPPSYLTAYIEEEKKRDEAEISGWKTRLGSIGVDAECAIVLGRLHESFSKVIEETSPELLVLGYKSHVLRLSSSERLIRSLTVPMLVVRGRAAEGSSLGSVEIRDILCPVDFSDNAKRAVSAAQRYAELFGARIHIIHVIPSHLIKEKWAAWKKLGDDDRDRFDASMRSEAESAMEALRLTFGIREEGEVFQGDPPEVIASLALERNCGLIAIGARGVSGVESVPVGSTVDSVLRTSPCPVLIVH
jgi:nucleotide-binding universal stress UspA family protein